MTTPIERLTDTQVREALTTLPGWALKGGLEISRQYTFRDFVEAMRFVNRVAELAEAADHHPDITIRYTRVVLVLATHSAGGLTEKDVALARQIDATAQGGG